MADDKKDLKPKEPEKPAGPMAAPRSRELEQIDHINLSELYALIIFDKPVVKPLNIRVDG